MVCVPLQARAAVVKRLLSLSSSQGATLQALTHANVDGWTALLQWSPTGEGGSPGNADVCCALLDATARFVADEGTEQATKAFKDFLDQTSSMAATHRQGAFYGPPITAWSGHLWQLPRKSYTEKVFIEEKNEHTERENKSMQAALRVVKRLVEAGASLDVYGVTGQSYSNDVKCSALGLACEAGWSSKLKHKHLGSM